MYKRKRTIKYFKFKRIKNIFLEANKYLLYLFISTSVIHYNEEFGILKNPK